MIFKPILPIWIMAIVCLVLIFIRPKNKKSCIITIIICVLLFLVNLRPMIMSSDVVENANDLDVIFVIDNTISMAAEDYKQNMTRFEGVGKDCEYIIKELAGARFMVISFDNSAKVRLPFSNDGNLAIDSTSMFIYPNEYYAMGSSLNTPKELLLKTLQRNEKQQRKTIVFFISDGEITDKSSLESYAEIKKYVKDGAVLGYGTTEGGKMKIEKYDYNRPENERYYLEYMEYYDPEVHQEVYAISKYDESTLRQIAGDIGIEYIHMDRQSNIDKKLKDIKNMAYNTPSDKTDAYTDLYYLMIIPIIVLIIIEYLGIKRRMQ